MDNVDSLSHSLKVKGNEDKMDIQYEIDLAQFKTLLADLKDDSLQLLLCS
jgi:hypothetical protein